MPLDPNIPLSATMPKINTPFENLQQILGMQEAKQQAQARELAIREKDGMLKEQAALQSALSSLPDLSDASMQQVMKVAPRLGTKWASDVTEQRQKAFAALKTKSDMEAAEAERGLSLLGVAEALGPDAWPDLAPVIAKHVPDLAPVLPQQFDPQRIGALRQAGVKAADQLKADREAMVGLMKGDYGTLASAIAKVDDPAERQERLTAWRNLGVPAKVLQMLATDPQSFEMTPDKRADNEARAVAERRQAAAQEETASHNRVMEQQGAARVGLARQAAAKGDAADRVLVAVQGPDGQPVLVPRAQAVGKRPAGGAGGAGGTRNVTSGDAGRLAEITSAINEARELEPEVSGTGAGSAIGAMLPNAITEATGIGADAKARQAVIARVKQVIGKGLEGGVLRKEDEAKYAAILPAIGDPPDVAAKKLRGLQAALSRKREDTLSALEDAGYNTANFRARGTGGEEAKRADAGSGNGPDLAGLRDGAKRQFRTGPYAGQVWTMVDGQPRRVQ